MIVTIFRKELTEYRRDGRITGLLVLILLLATVSLITGWATHAAQQNQVHQAQRADQTVFSKLGEKTPHGAAHFGRMAFKPWGGLAAFDPGSAPYLGQVIWLEAHSRSPAMFRPAEDAPEMGRLADLNVAGILVLLLPLLIFILGHGAFARERERGTLRQLTSGGVALKHLFWAKLGAVSAVGITAATTIIAISTVLALYLPRGADPLDIVLRGSFLSLSYSIYCVALAALALLVSALAGRTSTALLFLLCLWAGSTALMPRLAAQIAGHVYPTPDSGHFWTQAKQMIRSNRPDRESETYRKLARQVLAKALNRPVSETEAAVLQVNRRGLNLEISEILGARAFAHAYDALFQTYAKQRRLRRFFTLVSPTIALKHVSSALSGTAIGDHRHFSQAAETQRNLIVSKMNADMMLNGAGQSYNYVAGADFWKTIPNFQYKLPLFASAIRESAADFALLTFWCLAVLGLAWQAASKQKEY